MAFHAIQIHNTGKIEVIYVHEAQTEKENVRLHSDLHVLTFNLHIVY